MAAGAGPPEEPGSDPGTETEKTAHESNTPQERAGEEKAEPDTTLSSLAAAFSVPPDDDSANGGDKAGTSEPETPGSGASEKTERTSAISASPPIYEVKRSRMMSTRHPDARSLRVVISGATAAAALTVAGTASATAQNDGSGTGICRRGIDHGHSRRGRVRREAQGRCHLHRRIGDRDVHRLRGLGNDPRRPGNHNDDGPVVSAVNAPTYSACSTSLPGVEAAVTTSGEWTVSMQNGSPSTAGLTMPSGGFVLKTSGLAECTVTAAPDGPATATGEWANGSPSTLAFSAAAVPVKVEGGFGCPTSTTSSEFGATYEVTDTSDAGADVSVTS